MPSKKKKTTRQSAPVSPFRMRYLLVADDARTELLNKVLVIGLYGGLIRAAATTSPVRLPSLAFILGCDRLGSERAETATFHIEGPTDAYATQNTFPLKAGSEDSLTLVVRIGDPVLEVGTYTVFLTLNHAYTFTETFTVTLDPSLLEASS